MGDASSAISYFEESVEFLSKLPKDDMEVISLELLLKAVYITWSSFVKFL